METGNLPTRKTMRTMMVIMTTKIMPVRSETVEVNSGSKTRVLIMLNFSASQIAGVFVV